MSTVSSTASSPPADTAAAIQPGGFLLGIDEHWQLAAHSANIGRFFPGATTGAPLADLIGDQSVHMLRNLTALLRAPTSVARLHHQRLGQHVFDLALHRDRDMVLIEGEPAAGGEPSDPIATVRALAASLAGLPLDPLIDTALRQVRALTAFDRAAIYQGNSLRADSRRTLAPAPDVMPPSWAQAPMLIADVGGTPESIVGKDAVRPLRQSPDPTFRQSLGEGQIAAALTLPLLIDGVPWGLIVAHHPHARGLSGERLGALELFADLLACRIEIALLRAR